MTLRWMSLVPPAIVRQRLKRNEPTHAAASPSSTAASAPISDHADLLHVLVVLHAEQLAHRGFGARRIGAGERLQRHAEAEHRERVARHDEITGGRERERVVRADRALRCARSTPTTPPPIVLLPPM